MPSKLDVLNACVYEINNRIQAFHKILNDLKDGAQNDSKSSAGDKHETSRAMMQIEQEKIGKQLKEAEEMKIGLEKIDYKSIHQKVGIGSLILTNAGLFFLAVPLGKIKVNHSDVFVLSPQSPLGNKLLGANLNDKITINSKQFIVNTIS
jgi:hypothetical protein